MLYEAPIILFRTDEFILDCPSLGTLKRLRISHNNKGFSAGWFLDKVIVDDIENNRVYEFPCGRWLAKDEDDGQISRDLLPGIGIDQAPPGGYMCCQYWKQCS